MFTGRCRQSKSLGNVTPLAVVVCIGVRFQVELHINPFEDELRPAPKCA
jgi:hypothetical protein